MRPQNCTACHQPVRWALTVNSKYIPLNPHPDPDGNQAAFFDATSTMRTRQLGKDQKPAAYERVYMPHVATCTGQQRGPQPRRLAAAPPPTNVIPISRARGRQRGSPNSPAPRRGA